MDDFVDVHLKGLVDHVLAGVNELLTRVEKDVQQLECEVRQSSNNLSFSLSRSLAALTVVAPSR